MTPTPFPSLTNISSPVDLMRYNNTVTSNLFGPTIVIGLWFILFLSFSNYSKDRAFMASTTITFILSSLLWALNLIPFELVGFVFIATLGSALMMFKGGS